MSIGDRFVGQLMDSEQWKRNVMQAIYEQTSGEIQGLHLASISAGLGHTPPAIAAQENRIQSRILHKLAFWNMSDRERRIPKAHDRTYEWIFGDLEHGSLPTSSNFKSFLQRSDEKIYWITGKPGSGKSTLMKFIRHRTETTDILRAWGGADSVVKAAFYFWNSGARMQMTVEGLLQTVLHECLEQLKSVIQDVLPERWEVATLFDVDDFPWTLEETAQALRRLFSEVCPDKKFFLLIDGLDECSGDQTQLIELISELAQESENLKICVASRPWTKFEDAFRGRPSLLLQDLTQHDIKHYIQSKFSTNIGFAEFQVRDPVASDKLLSDISMKAEGVFLWVHLVVQSLLEGLTNGDRVRDLQRRLNELPRGLEDLYANILKNLDINYLEHASQLFQIVRACDDSPTLLCVAFADLDDGQQALKAPTRPLSLTETSSLCKNMRRKLTSRCLGLLDVSSSNDAPIFDLLNTSSNDKKPSIDREECDQGLEVQYLHRSVRDYIEDPEVWKWLVSANNAAFDPNLVLFKANILRLKHNNQKLITSKLFLRILTAIKYARRSLLTGKNKTQRKEIIRLLDELDNACTSLRTLNGRNHSNQVFGDRCGDLHDEHWSSFLLLRTERPSFMHLMAVCGISQYLERRLMRSEDNDDETDSATPLILTAMTGDLAVPEKDTYPTFDHPDIEVLRVILKKGGNCYQKWKGTSAWMLAAKLKNTEVLDLFRRHCGKPPKRSNSPGSQKGSQSGGESRADRSSGESDDGSDAESITSTEARDGYDHPDDTPRTDPHLALKQVRRAPSIGQPGPLRVHRRDSHTNNDRRRELHDYPDPQHYPPRPAYSHAPPALPQPPPVREYVYFYPPPRRYQQWHNPFIQPPFGYQPRSNYSYRSGQGYYGLPSRPDLVPDSWYYSVGDAQRGFPYPSMYQN